MKPRVLIIGTEGTLGGALLTACRRQGFAVTGTSQHRGSAPAGIQELDLGCDLSAWVPPADCAVAFLCAGITRLETCRRDPAGTRAINVLQTLRLTERLIAAGLLVVFPSSNLVFDGARPCQRAEDPRCPQTEYGRQKAEVEAGCAAFGDRVAIVRLTKVVHPRWPLVRGWVDNLRVGLPVEPFGDLVCAPIPLELTVRGLLEIGWRQQSGIWQFSAPADVAYGEIAVHLARRLSGDQRLIRIRSVRDQASEPVPQHTTLDTARARTELGLEFPAPLRVIEEAFGC